MPYIVPHDRHKFKVNKVVPENPGELNYLITLQILHYVESHGKCYTTINDVLGALEGAKIEFYRRVASPYENLKRDLNGDVYEDA